MLGRATSLYQSRQPCPQFADTVIRQLWDKPLGNLRTLLPGNFGSSDVSNNSSRQSKYSAIESIKIIFLHIIQIRLEIFPKLVYNMGESNKRGAVKVAAVKVKPIQPTIISDIGIIRDVIREATTKPSPAAIVRNKEASELLRRLQRNADK